MRKKKISQQRKLIYMLRTKTFYPATKRKIAEDASALGGGGKGGAFMSWIPCREKDKGGGGIFVARKSRS